jgi:hypothetical protein
MPRFIVDKLCEANNTHTRTHTHTQPPSNSPHFEDGTSFRHGVNVSYVGCEHGGHWCNIIMHHNTLKFHLFVTRYHGES